MADVGQHLRHQLPPPHPPSRPRRYTDAACSGSSALAGAGDPPDDIVDTLLLFDQVEHGVLYPSLRGAAGGVRPPAQIAAAVYDQPGLALNAPVDGHRRQQLRTRNGAGLGVDQTGQASRVVGGHRP